jgi:hypothetical protein
VIEQQARKITAQEVEISQLKDELVEVKKDLLKSNRATSYLKEKITALNDNAKVLSRDHFIAVAEAIGFQTCRLLSKRDASGFDFVQHTDYWNMLSYPSLIDELKKLEDSDDIVLEFFETMINSCVLPVSAESSLMSSSKDSKIQTLERSLYTTMWSIFSYMNHEKEHPFSFIYGQLFYNISGSADLTDIFGNIFPGGISSSRLKTIQKGKVKNYLEYFNSGRFANDTEGKDVTVAYDNCGFYSQGTSETSVEKKSTVTVFTNRIAIVDERTKPSLQSKMDCHPSRMKPRGECPLEIFYFEGGPRSDDYNQYLENEMKFLIKSVINDATDWNDDELTCKRSIPVNNSNGEIVPVDAQGVQLVKICPNCEQRYSSRKQFCDERGFKLGCGKLEVDPLCKSLPILSESKLRKRQERQSNTDGDCSTGYTLSKDGSKVVETIRLKDGTPMRSEDYFFSKSSVNAILTDEDGVSIVVLPPVMYNPCGKVRTENELNELATILKVANARDVPAGEEKRLWLIVSSDAGAINRQATEVSESSCSGIIVLLGDFHVCMNTMAAIYKALDAQGIEKMIKAHGFESPISIDLLKGCGKYEKSKTFLMYIFKPALTMALIEEVVNCSGNVRPKKKIYACFSLTDFCCSGDYHKRVGDRGSYYTLS